jgi:hypothetical protein
MSVQPLTRPELRNRVSLAALSARRVIWRFGANRESIVGSAIGKTRPRISSCPKMDVGHKASFIPAV